MHVEELEKRQSAALELLMQGIVGSLEDSVQSELANYQPNNTISEIYQSYGDFIAVVEVRGIFDAYIMVSLQWRDFCALWGTERQPVDARSIEEKVCRALDRVSKSVVTILGQGFEANPEVSSAKGTWSKLLFDRASRFQSRSLKGKSIGIEGCIGIDAVGFELLFLRKQLEEADERISSALKSARKYQRNVERTRRNKSHFLISLSRKIRTPMSDILGCTELLQDSLLDGVQRELVDTVALSGESIMRLIDDVLDLSEIEAGRLSLDNHEVRIEELAIQVYEQCQLAARPRQVTLSIDIGNNEYPVVWGDALRIRQVLVHLLNNAVTYSPQGWVELKLRNRGLGNENSVFEFEITDNGMGIPEDQLKEIASRLRGEPPRVSSYSTIDGLGLTICSQIVELLNGKLSVSSKLGEGSTFRFELTLPHMAANDSGWSSRRYSSVDSSSRDIIPLRNLERPSGVIFRPGMRVLLAEDNPINQMVYSRMLGKLGVSVDLADNGEQAVALARADAWDLIFMDIQMPLLDGYAATRRIRADSRSRSQSVPIIALTANAELEERNRCTKAGMDDYLCKPVKLDNLRHALSIWADQENAA